MLPWLNHDSPFPPIERALPDGLLCASEDLNPERVFTAYQQGIFPWFSPGQPVLWWSLDPRMVLHTSELRITRALAKTLRNRAYEVRVDSAFEAVMRACGSVPREGQNGTWITQSMIQTYAALHAQGIAHSVETWSEGELIGGLYGLCIGRMFYGESMFSKVTDASKIAFAHLVPFLAARGCTQIDCQMYTEHLASFGAREIDRRDFVAELKRLIALPPIDDWQQLKHHNHGNGRSGMIESHAAEPPPQNQYAAALEAALK